MAISNRVHVKRKSFLLSYHFIGEKMEKTAHPARINQYQYLLFEYHIETNIFLKFTLIIKTMSDNADSVEHQRYYVL